MTPRPSDIRVVVCDDHALFRRGIVMELDEADGLEVVGEAADGDEAVDVAVAMAPDVVLMDVRMPATDGIAATRTIVEALHSTQVVMLSVSGDEDHLFEAVRAGAIGYMLKESSIDTIAGAVRAAAAGHSFLSPMLAARLLGEFRDRLSRGASPTRTSAGPAVGADLTTREVSIVELLADGADNGQIADALELSEPTVRQHVRNVLSKLHIQTRTEAVLFAVREGLINP